MDDDKTVNLSLEAATRGEKGEFGEPSSSSSSRARNRTVMLTPEITGQVRARLAQDPHQDPNGSVGHGMVGAPTQLLGGQQGGFESVRGSVHTPPLQGGPLQGGRGAPEPIEQSRFYQPPPTAVPVQRDREGIIWVKESPVVGFLVSYDVNENGQVYELRVGRVMVTNQSQGETNTLVIKSETVSAMHAIIRIGARGDIQVLDQLSESGTTIRRFSSGEEEHLAGDKGDLEHGDVVKFGDRSFYVCIVPRPTEG